ncbi:MAG: aldose 1-epimerase family protein [Solobacterium sp.]|nr:aldose 1-epimerase family protein [Solobacterium sp.]
MASYVLENAQAKVIIDEHASEIHSFVNKKTGLEYMWQGDPAFWSGRNPTLFPMVGSTWDKKLHIGGKEYVTGNHGFTRRSDFTCISCDGTALTNELKDSEATRKEYPFGFDLKITYTLDQATLTVDYAITNTNDEVMPFNFGLHPAFNCPIEKDKQYADYRIEFNNAENIHWLDTNLDDTKVLPLNPDDLAKTVILSDPKSTVSTLTDGVHGVSVGYENYPWLAFWSPNAPFVCIEPWHSHTDFDKVEVPFEKREGTLFLNPGDTFRTSYTITVW